MAKVPVAVRLEPDVVEWLDGYARSRKVSRQSILEAAVSEFREACAGGVPELPVDGVRPVTSAVPAKVSIVTGWVRKDAQGSYWKMMRERQERANRAAGR